MRNAFKVSAAVLLMATLAWASTPWKTKPYKSWTRKEVEEIFNHSPWVSTAEVTAYWRAKVSKPTMVGPYSGGPQIFPTIQGTRLRPREIFLARWMSALTMREAVARFGTLKWKTGVPISAANVLQRPPEYQIVVRGSDLFPFAQLGERGLAKASYIELGSPKGKILPSGVKFYRTIKGLVAAATFTFPKSVSGKPTIPAGEKQIVLVCKLKKTTVKFYFDPRKMANRSGRDL